MKISPNSEAKPCVHRQLIQSTLFPHKSPDNVVSVDEEITPDLDHQDDEDDDICESQENKKRKEKAVSKSEASRKLAVNGNENGGKNTIEEDSPATVKVDFFAKVSERRNQQRQQKEKLPIHSPEKIEPSCSAPDVITSMMTLSQQASVTPEKLLINSTPSTNAVNVVLNEYIMLASPPQPVLNLRLETKLIQSTLFPLKSQDSVVCVDEEIEPDLDQEDNEGEDYCKSQKNKKRKGKTASNSRASRKLSVNGNEIGGKTTNEEDSPATVKVDFFVKVSERRNQQRQQKEQLLIHSPEKIEQSCSPPDVITNSKSSKKPRRRASFKPKKQQTSVTPEILLMDSTPSTNAVNDALNEDHSDIMLASPPKPIPNLLLETKLIQSTLIPHKSQDSVVCVDEEIKPDVDQEDDEDDYCGSQSQIKTNKKRKPKAASKSRARRKLAVNGNENGVKNTNEEDSPATVKVDFFVKVSERRNQRRQQKEQLPICSLEKIEQSCSPPDVITNSKSPRKPRRRASSTPKKRQASVTPEKRRKNSTPSRNGVNGTLNEDYSDTMLGSPTKPIPDLRLEAKMTAEENARIFAGKQVHPFFSSWKTGKKNSESTGTENNWCYVERKESKDDCSPVHIFEKTQGETFSVDWKNWTFFETISTRSGHHPEDACSHLIYEGSVNCLQFDNFLEIPPFEISLCQNIEVVREVGKTGGLPEKSEFVVNLDTQWQDTLFTERMASSYHDCSCQPENSLWTTKYQPEKAIEICGNCKSVKLLNEWLHLWHEKGSRTNKCSTDIDNWIMQGVDLNYCPTDSDSEDADENNSLKNVLLVTGPVGSGKSAAIYACAKEQGFQVIEVNTSDWRNGALVKQKFGEAVESHWLQHSILTIENQDNKSQLKSTPSSPARALLKTKAKREKVYFEKEGKCNVEAVQTSDNDVIELIPLSDDSKSLGGPAVKPVSSQNGIKTLILFEDVDATLYEDRGFIATIQQLAETAKRPMILTSNSDDPDLPNNLDRIEVSFRIPSSDELLSLASMVCKTEKAEIERCLVERFIEHCQGDIRKTITLLQFWCQGENHRKDGEVRNTYAPLVFDTYAGHHVLPQMIPCGYTSKLSEMIENEITKSTLLTKKDASLMEIIEEEEENNSDSTMNVKETHDIDAKKDEMLRMHCSDQDGNDFAFTRRTLQKKYDALMSSDSETCWKENITEDVNELMPVETRNSRKKYNAVLSSDSEDECFNESFSQENKPPSGDVSCVPESSYVPETIIENGTMMYSTMCSSGCVDDGIEEASKNTDCPPKTIMEEDKVPVIMVRDLVLETVPVHGEETGDSNNEPMEAFPREYQMMDECSRIDFSKNPVESSIHDSKTAVSTDIVQETWRKLRNCSKELSQYVSSEETDTLEALEISYGMTNLISEADLLLADCDSLTCDYLKPSKVSNEKSHSYSWHDDQLQMASTFAQHGFCLYAKRSFAAGSNARVDLALEMLAASTNGISLGKLVNRNNKVVKNLENKKLQSGVSSKSMLESLLCNTVQSILPLRSQFSLKGYVFHEYLSSLSQISRSESSRLSEAVNKTDQRRKRVARNYLSNGSLSLSSEDIALLDQYKCYQKHSTETKTES